MSNWKVSKEKIEIFDHPNAEKLQLGKVGTYQVVVQKGIYKGGETVVFAPEKSVLTGLLEQEWKNYLVGPDKNRVKAVVLRGEMSCGIIIPDEIVKQVTGKSIAELPDAEDISEQMGITKYVPVIPTNLAGEIEVMPSDMHMSKHDVEQFGVYASEFQPGERVVITEKVHGSQAVYYIRFMPDGQIIKWASSKGFAADGLCIKESEKNGYWRGANDIGLWDILTRDYKPAPWKDEVVVQVFGEAIPCQGANWTYGKKQPSLVIFKVAVNGTVVPHDMVSEDLKKNWVPVLYDGPYEDVKELRKLSLGNEAVSGEELHIKEGIVIAPYWHRRAADGTRLLVKVLNPAYKETGEEIN